MSKRRSTAHHEAGHYIADRAQAHAVGYPYVMLGHLEIAPPGEVLTGRDGGMCKGRVRFFHRPVPSREEFENAAPNIRHKILRIARNRIITNLGGPIAQDIYNDWAGLKMSVAEFRIGATKDLHTARQIARTYPEISLSECHATAEQFVRTNWHSVTYLAGALVKRLRIDFDDVEELLSEFNGESREIISRRVA
jgi:hypothetical protein